MDTKVHCIHCDKEYLYKEASVVNYPECDGSLIDMMEVEE